MSDSIWDMINDANMRRLNPNRNFCNFCGGNKSECGCIKCEKCGDTGCEHLQEQALAMLLALGKAIKQEKARREAEGKENP